MAQIILVTGGVRSGKSNYAQARAEELSGSRAYVATCPAAYADAVADPEMAARIARHRQSRQAAGWQTVEEPRDLAGRLANDCSFDVLLVDCLTLWVSNLLAADPEAAVGEEEIARRSAELLAVCRQRSGIVIFVTNEVGWGVVPENPLARRFRDLVGRCNQVVAAGADEVIMVVCGMATKLK